MFKIHRRSIKSEEKAKVVAVVWGTELIQFLFALATLNDLKSVYDFNYHEETVLYTPL